MAMLKTPENHLKYLTPETIILSNKEKPYRLTPIMVTFYEGVLTRIDIQKMIEMGVQIVRFKMTHVTRTDKIKLLFMLNTALEWMCEKYDVNQWPLAVCMDVPNACIRSGYISDSVPTHNILLKKNSIVELTSDVKYWNQCTPTRIFMDDPDTMKTILVGTAISLSGYPVEMICTEVIDHQTILCKVMRSGIVENCEFICIRNVQLKRPSLQDRDLELIKFAKEFRFDIITMNWVRTPITIKRLRKFFGDDYSPLIISSIAEQEGVDRFDEILKVSDGIVMAREFLAYNLDSVYKLHALQMMMSGKCKQAGKPFFISGNVMEHTLKMGILTTNDLSDITNAVIQGAGFIIKEFSSPANAIAAMDMLNTVCKSVESLGIEDEFRTLCEEFLKPANAAEVCIISCVMMMRQTGSAVVVVPTVTGKTAVQLSHIAPHAIILAISANPEVARKLQVCKGIVSIIYDKESLPGWYQEYEARIQFAVSYGVKKNLLKYGDSYVTLFKSTPTSSYCDSISQWTVKLRESGKLTLECEEDGRPKQPRRVSGPNTHLLGIHRSAKQYEHHKHHGNRKPNVPVDDDNFDQELAPETPP